MVSPARILIFTTSRGQLRLRLPAACVAIEDDPKHSRVIRAETRLRESDGGESVEVALFPAADDFLWQLIGWLRRPDAACVRRGA
ncbi:MAG: hypothetical protein IPK80_11640 [Nannocystis sp.]|nr:hypothetical protein [Nannocystis sp.]